MAIAYVGATEYYSGTSNSETHVITLPSFSTGDLCIVVWSHIGNFVETDTNYPAGWSFLTDWWGTSGACGGTRVLYRIMEAGDPSTMTITREAFQGIQAIANAICYSGTATTLPFDSTPSVWYNTGTNPGTAPVSEAITTTTTNTMILRLLSFDDDGDMTEGSAFPAGVTNRAFGIALDAGAGNGGYIALGEDGAQASAGTTGTATWTADASDGWATMTIAIRDAANDPVIADKDFTFDGVFAKTFTKDNTFDSILSKTVTKDVTMDAILQFQGQGDVIMDSILQKQGIQKDVTFDAELVIAVSNTLTCQYDMVSFVSSTLTALSDIKNLVENEVILVYGLGGLVSNTVTLLYDIHNLVSNTLTGIQSTLDYVSSTLTGLYDIRQFVSNTLTGIQSTLDYVSSTLTSPYDIFNNISSTLTSKYDILIKHTKIALKNARRKIKLFR